MLLTALPLRAAIELPQADRSVLRLEQPARRLITLSPHLAELVFAAGLGDHLLATVEFSDYPEQAAQLPRIGDAFRLDIEQIIALQPDLVVTWHSGNPQQAVRRLQALGIVTWSIEIEQPAGIADVLEWLGRASGQVGPADAAAAQVRARLNALSRRYDQTEPVSYFYQVAGKPLFTINGRHLIAQGLALCGGRNVFAAQGVVAPQVSHEAVIAANPQALLAPVSSAEPDPLALWREWPSLQAIASGSLYLLPADEISRATPRFIHALEQACQQLQATRAWQRASSPPDLTGPGG